MYSCKVSQVLPISWNGNVSMRNENEAKSTVEACKLVFFCESLLVASNEWTIFDLFGTLMLATTNIVPKRMIIWKAK